ncbi:MAG: hypothetical protein WC878_02490 [Candidatus Paceibacterota bacterium]|jgi:hypothetical protein
MSKVQKRRARNALIFIPIFICLFTAVIYFSDAILPQITNAFGGRIHIPETPVAVRVLKTELQDTAVIQAVTFVGETMATQCQWSEEKIESDYYLPYANIDVKVYEGYVTAEAMVDKSVCPEK